MQERKAKLLRFKDDGAIPNHPRWPVLIYKAAVQLPDSLDPAAVFEALFERNGWGGSWRDGIYDYVHYHSRIHEVLGIARGSGKVQFGGAHGRALALAAGDVAVLPAGNERWAAVATSDLGIGAAADNRRHRWQLSRRRSAAATSEAVPQDRDRRAIRRCHHASVANRARRTSYAVYISK